MYALGIDLGTTYTAAATWRDGHAEVASLGSRASVIPSVVLLREDETVLTGETAHRRGVTEPHRVSREFKRRLGDTTPILLGGVPHSAEALMARLLRWVLDEVSRREGAPPSRLAISHPANWGPYKKDLLTQAVRMANVDQPVSFTTEPEAAAVFYARQQRVEPGAVVAVYDLGGGTFDAAVLRKTATGFEILGQPEGIERLGGIDFDSAVFNHVRQALGGRLEELNEDDPAVVAAVARLREECVSAKEVLSSDTDASIPVLLPNLSTEIRITRAELEAMVRPTLFTTIEALRRALQSAQVSPEQLHSVLLVGGSSRMPLVAQLVGAELGRPVAVDAHPKHAVALGAAWLASGAAGGAAGAAGAPGPATTHSPPTQPATAGSAGGGARTTGAGAVAGAAAAGAVAGAAAAGAAAAGPADRHQTYAGSATVPAGAPTGHGGTPPGGHGGAGGYGATASSGGYGQPAYPAAAQYAAGGGPPPPPGPPGPPGPRPAGGGGSKRRLALIAAGATAFVLLAGAVAWAVSGDDDDPGPPVANESDEPSGGPGGTPTEDPGQPTDPQIPPDEECTEAIMSNPRWVCLTSARMDGDQLVIEYDVEWDGSVPDTNGGFHLHIYGGDGSDPADEVMGTQASNQGVWKIHDEQPAILDATDIANVIGDAPKVCARIADSGHALVPDLAGGYTTGNCVPIG